jgi:hypothetical protein
MLENYNILMNSNKSLDKNEPSSFDGQPTSRNFGRESKQSSWVCYAVKGTSETHYCNIRVYDNIPSLSNDNKKK